MSTTTPLPNFEFVDEQSGPDRSELLRLAGILAEVASDEPEVRQIFTEHLLKALIAESEAGRLHYTAARE